MEDELTPELEQLRERIVRSIVATLGPMLAPHAKDRLYVVALTTDSDATTVRLTAHTEEALAELIGDDPDADSTYRWWPDEWEIVDDDVVPDDGVAPLVDRSAEVAAAAAGDGDRWTEQVRVMLDGALGDPRVAARLAEINSGWRPVRFVTDTDGAMDRTVRSIDTLNTADAPLAADARAYFAEDF